jgi:PST family polysaccharide transporter
MRRRLSALRDDLGRPTVQRLLRNTSWHVGDRAFRLGVGFLVGVWVARYLGPERFGMLSYAMAVAALLGSAATLGTDNVVLRELVQRPGEEGAILASASAVRLAGALLSAAAIVFAALAMEQGHPQVRLLVLLAGAAILFKPFDAADVWFQSRTDSGPPVRARGAAFLLVTATKVGLVLAVAPVAAFAACEPLTAGLSALFLLVAYARRGRRFTLAGASWREARYLLRESWPLLLAGMAIMVYTRIDQVMLENMLGPQGASAVGLYSVALRLSEVWYFVPMAIVPAVFPALVEARKQGEAAYLALFGRLLSLMSALALGVALPMTFLSGPVIRLVFGGRYQGAGPILAVHIWTTLFVFWGVVAEAWYLNEGLARLTLYRTVAAACLNVLLNLVLIPRWGGLGAAVATLIAQASSAWLSNLALARTRPMFFLQLRSLRMRGLFPG